MLAGLIEGPVPLCYARGPEASVNIEVWDGLRAKTV